MRDQTGFQSFDVLLTVHFSIFVLVTNQLDAQNFCFTISLFHASTCFEHMCSSSGGQNCIIQPLVSSFMSLDVLRTIYFAYVHSVISYGIIFWGNSFLSANIFKIQKRIIKIITNIGKRESCRQLFKQLQILPLHSQYIYSLLVFVNKNKELFMSNSVIHNINNTRYKHNLHLPSTHLTLVQKGVLYSGSKIFSHLPLCIKAHSNDPKCFKTKLKSYLIEHTFYSIDEYYQH
jgi:hypothetical protein